jgi:hypothetical protein
MFLCDFVYVLRAGQSGCKQEGKLPKKWDIDCIYPVFEPFYDGYEFIVTTPQSFHL